MPDLASRSEASTLLILGKRQMCESLSVQGYARSHGLTPAETRVLAALCQPAILRAEAELRVAPVRTAARSWFSCRWCC